jgi:hypothetical protein
MLKHTNDNYGLGHEDRSVLAIMGEAPDPTQIWTPISYAALIEDRTNDARRFDPAQRERAIAFLAVGSCNRNAAYNTFIRTGKYCSLRLSDCGTTVTA